MFPLTVDEEPGSVTHRPLATSIETTRDAVHQVLDDADAHARYKAIARLSGHLAVMCRTVYPYAGREPGSGVQLGVECLSRIREVQWTMRALECHLSGCTSAAGRPVLAVSAALGRQLGGYWPAEQALVGWVEEQLDAAGRDRLAARVLAGAAPGADPAAPALPALRAAAARRVLVARPLGPAARRGRLAGRGGPGLRPGPRAAGRAGGWASLAALAAAAAALVAPGKGILAADGSGSTLSWRLAAAGVAATGGEPRGVPGDAGDGARAGRAGSAGSSWPRRRCGSGCATGGCSRPRWPTSG